MSQKCQGRREEPIGFAAASTFGGADPPKPLIPTASGQTPRWAREGSPQPPPGNTTSRPGRRRSQAGSRSPQPAQPAPGTVVPVLRACRHLLRSDEVDVTTNDHGLSEMFGLSYPVMSPPMSMPSGGTLAAAGSAAGGLGCFGGMRRSLELVAAGRRIRRREFRRDRTVPFKDPRRSRPPGRRIPPLVILPLLLRTPAAYGDERRCEHGCGRDVEGELCCREPLRRGEHEEDLPDGGDEAYHDEGLGLQGVGPQRQDDRVDDLDEDEHEQDLVEEVT